MITDEEFTRISVFMKRKYGIDLSQKKVIVNGRLENYLKRNGWNTCSEFLDEVKKDQTGEKERVLVNYLTTNHTYFMREFVHFDFFKDVVLPWLRVKEERSKDLRIWCGASSTGEEPYMIAMVLADFFGLARDQWDTKVLATDISTQALQTAVQGIYSADRLEQLPPHWKKAFLQPLPGRMQYQIKDELRQEVIFRKLNLMDPFPFRKKMHTIFLRNVMIYFDEPTKRELVQKIYDALVPGGYLFIGTTETLDRVPGTFELVQPSIYRKKEGTI